MAAQAGCGGVLLDFGVEQLPIEIAVAESAAQVEGEGLTADRPCACEFATAPLSGFIQHASTREVDSSQRFARRAPSRPASWSASLFAGALAMNRTIRSDWPEYGAHAEALDSPTSGNLHTRTLDAGTDNLRRSTHLRVCVSFVVLARGGIGGVGGGCSG